MSFNSGSKSKETQESWESLLRKTMSKDRLFHLSRPAENPIHWIHFLDPFDQHDSERVAKSAKIDDAKKSGVASSGTKNSLKNQTLGDKLPTLKIPEAVAALAQAAAKASGESRVGSSMDLPGWPLIPFSKVQTMKCEKCRMEFCSPLNHRRHLRMMHRRPVNAEKEGSEILKQQLATFWDNLSPEEAYRVVASKNLVVEDLTGDKVVRALSQLLQQATLFVLPPSYVKAGALLLELVQSRSSRLFHTSSELFDILDGSSEKTFPTSGLSAMQRYVFEGGAGKIGLEIKNLVASLGFLVEYNLMKAFIKNKDEEALRCQTALVEEEEASLRKQAELQEKRRMKKVRQLKDREPKFPELVAESDSDASDGGIVTENASENLYNRLAGDMEQQENYTKIDVSEEVPILDNPDEKVTKNVEACASDGSDGKDQEVGTVPDSCGFASENLEIVSAQNNGSFPPDGSITLNPLIVQKRKYAADRVLPFKEKKGPLVRVSQSWKERNTVDARKLCYKRLSIDSKGKEQSGQGFEAPLTPSGSPRMTTLVDSPGSTGPAYGPKKYVIRPAKIRRNAIWTKKLPTSVLDERTYESMDLSLQATEMSGIAMPEVDPVPTSAPSSNMKGWTSDSAHDLNGQAPKPLSHQPEQGPIVPGQSVVIGSVSVSLVEPLPFLSSCTSPIMVTIVDEALDKTSIVEKPHAHPAGIEATSRALQENGLLKSVTHTQPENEKLSNLLLQDPEDKENKRVCVTETRHNNFTTAAATAMPGGGFRGGKVKIWRPVGSGSYQERALGVSPFVSDSNCSPENNVLTGGKEVANDKGRENFNSEGHSIPSFVAGMDHPSMWVGANMATGQPCNGLGFCSSSLTYKSIACLLSQRWCDAINDPDSIILSFDDVECHLSQGTMDPPNEQLKSVHMASRLRPEARPFNGRRRWQQGSWKQGYLNGFTAANRRMTAKDHLHLTFRPSGFRYVPK